MITKDGERNPNSGKSKAEQASNKGQKKKNTGTGNKGGAQKTIPSASTSTPKTTPSSSTSGSLATPKPTESSTSNSSSSSSSSSSKKKSLRAVEKSKALSDLMDRATIGSSRTYGLSFQSSANQKISDAESKRKQTLVEQATKNGYLGKEKSGGYGSSGSFARESGGTGSSGSFERKSDGTGSYGSFDGKAKSATPSVLERVGNAMLGGAIQSGGTSLDAVGTMYQAGQGGRDTLYGENLEWYQHQLDTEEATLKSMQAENRAKPGTYNLKAIQNQQRIIAEAQKKVDAFSPVKEAQEKSGEAARNLAADVSNIGAKRTEQAKEGASALGKMALDALSSTAQMGVDAAANAVLGTPGSMLPFAFRAFGGGTQEARSEGATLEQQMAFGSAMAAKEIFTEKMFNIAGLQNKAYGKGSVDDYVEKAISGAVDKLAKTETGQRLIGGGLTLLGGAAGEGLEELIGDWMEWQLPRIYKKDPKSAKEVAQDSIYDFLVGALSGTFGGLASPGNILNYQQPGSHTQGQRIVDPTASPLDQAILDTLQGVQTPENVTQVREPTDLDNIIMETQMQLQSGISPEVATNKAKDVKNLLNATKEQISRFIQNAFNKQNQYQYLKLSDVSPELAATLKNAGIDVDGYAHALRDNDIRHVDSSHGAQSNDKYKVTADMLGDVQNVIDNYDVLYRGFDTRFGNPTVVYEKRMGNRTFYVEEVMSDGVLGTKQMVVTGESSKPSFLKKYTEIASVSDDTDVPARSGSTGQSPPGNHVPDAPYNTSYNSNVAQAADSVNRENVGADASTGAAPAGFDPLSHASNQYGAIPPGENPSRVVDIPASMDGETKVSRFSRTAAEAQITTDEMVGRIEQLVQDGKLSHEVYSNKQAIEDGAKQIEKQYARGKTIEQIRGEFIRDANAGKAGAKFVSQGTTLYADAIAEGDYNAASDILVALTAVETNAGQTVQAARLMKSLTPEGRIFTVQKMVSNLEAQINQRRAANKQIEINVPDALLQTYQNAATADAQEAALQNIYQNVADQIPTSLGEAAQQWRYFSMLANPSTHAKNIMGNVSGAVAKIGKDNLAALMETVFIGNKEGRTKAFLNPLNKADQNLLNLGWADYDNAVDLYEDSTGKYSNTAGDINDKRRYWKINDPQNALTRGIDKALNIAEKANNLNSKALEVEDMWFSKPMYSVALAGYMKANGLT